MIGKELGPYRVLSELGSGGMGTVYLAEDRDGSRLALKVVHPHLMGTPGFIRTVMREAELGKRIRHENVVATFDADGIEVDGKTVLFLAMEYIEGQTLRSLIEEVGRAPEQLCRHIGREISKALVAIHATGVVHRDLKPENILITPEQELKVMDLGVARCVDESIRLSQVGLFAGSVLYAAPEQFTKQEADARSDLYALGLVLYELATGQHPFAGDDLAAIMTRQVQEEPRPAAELNPQLSPFLEEVIKVLLAKDPEQRFVSASSLLEVLERGEDSRWWLKHATDLRARTKRPLRRIRIPRETALFGREGEIAKFRELFEQTRAGRGRILLVEGEAGIGKTRLVDEFVRRLQEEGEDVNFLFGSFPPGGAATAAGAFATAYREQFGKAGLEETLRSYLEEMPILVPAFAALLRGEPAPIGEHPLTKDSLQAVFVHATQSLAGERPTVVLIDDLHFAPEEGRALFAALALAVPGHPVLLIGTTRPGLPEEWVASLERLEHTTRVTVPRLGPKDLGDLLVDAFGSRRLARELGFQISTKSDGNPFFAFEIVRGLREGQLITQRTDGTWVRTQAIEQIQTPSSVLDLIQARIADLDEEDKDLLDVAACCGFEFDPSLVGEAVGLKRIPVLKRLARIERTHRLVRSAGLHFVFDHHQVQEALYDRLPGMLRQEYHAALGEALEQRAQESSPLDGARAVEVCDHFFRGDRGERALRFLDPALDHLEENYVNDAALRLADRALDQEQLTGSRRVEVLLRKCDRLHLLGRRKPERQAADEALKLADEDGDALLRARARRALGIHLWRVSAYEEARARLAETEQLAREADDRKLQARASGDLGNVLLHLGRYEEAGDHYQRQLELARAIGDRHGEGRALGNLGVIAMNVGRHDEAREPLEQALALAREIGDRRAEALTTGNLGALYFYLGRIERAGEYFDCKLALCRELGERQGAADATANTGFVCLHLGRYARARERFAQHLALAQEIGEPRGIAIAALNVGSVQAVLGESAAARERLEQALADLRQINARHWEGRALHCLGMLAELEGEEAEAARRYEQALEIRREIHHRNGVANTLLGLGRVELARGLTAAAAKHLEEAMTLSRSLKAPGTLLLAAGYRSLLPGGDPQVAQRVLADEGERIGVAEQMEARFVFGKATRERAEFEQAHRLLARLREHAPPSAREAMVQQVALHREIEAAWDQAQI